MKYRITARTHQGLVRDHNEDNFILNPDQRYQNWYFDTNRLYDISESAALWVVADGMGGANAGEIASEMAVMHLKKAFSSFDSKRSDAREFLQSTIIEASRKIYEASNTDHSKSGMGTTIVAALAVGRILTIAWVGDSRAYLYRNGKLQPITKDHSFVQQLVDAGKITPEEAFYHPQGNIILQSLGGEPDKVVPDTISLQLSAGDRVLLCTDGLHGMLQDNVIQDILTQYSGFEDAAHYLIDATLKEGAHDNVTLILAEIVQVGEDLSDFNAVVAAGTPLQTVKGLQNAPPESTPQKAGKNVFHLFVLFSVLIILFTIGVSIPWKKYINPDKTVEKDSTAVDTTNAALIVDSTKSGILDNPPLKQPYNATPPTPTVSESPKEPTKKQPSIIPVQPIQTPPPNYTLPKDSLITKPNPSPNDKDTVNLKPIELQKKPDVQDSINTFESNK